MPKTEDANIPLANKLDNKPVSDQDIRQIKKLLTVLKESGLEEVRIKIGSLSLETRRTPNSPVVPVAPALSVPSAQSVANIANPVLSPAPSTASPLPAETNTAEAGTPIKSPMVGTFYTSADPESPPFVQVGDKIAIGQTICIIEAMKLFNKIEAEQAGTLRKVLVENATAVEYDQPLFLIDPAS